MKNTITRAQIDALLAASEIDVCTKFDKVTVVTVKLPNGFVLVEASGAVDKANYSEEMGRKVCVDRIAQKLWSFEGYMLSTHLQHLPRIERKAYELCRQIERCGASTELTSASEQASELITLIGQLTQGNQ